MLGKTRRAKITVSLNLSPDAFLLDWNCAIRIRSFQHSIVFCQNLITPDIWSLFGSHYLRPECDMGYFGQKSYFFSFGMILNRLVVGQSLFERFSPYVVARLVAIDDVRPNIPEFVLPDVRNVRSDC